MNTYQKGNLSEAILTARLLECGYNVLIPVGGGHRYDLVIQEESGFKKIQVKTARISRGGVTFNTCSNNKGYSRKSYHGEVDLFGVYCPELNECYLIPTHLTGKSEMKLKIGPPKNNQTERVNQKDIFRINTPSSALEQYLQE